MNVRLDIDDANELEPFGAPETDSDDSLLAQNARLERERNHYQAETLRLLSANHDLQRRNQDLQRQLTAARAVAEVI